jgi:valyl-tRNA synthetase
MPFLTEELWHLTAPTGGRGSMLVLADWPDAPALETAEAEAEIGWLIDLVSEVRSVRTEMNISPGAQIPLVLVGANENVLAWARRYDAMLKRLARLSAISFSPDMPAGAIQLLVRGGTVALPIADVIDFAAERARLDKELGKIADEIGKIDKKLGNPDFLARAREDVVEEQHERRAEAEERRSKLSDALARLGSIA